MTYLQIGSTLIPAQISGIEHDRDWGYRHTKSVRCNLTYEEAKALFVDGVEWSQIYQGPDYTNEQGEVVTPDPIIEDNSQFEQVLSITENRDGTVTVKMGVTTAEEINAILMGGIRYGNDNERSKSHESVHGADLCESGAQHDQ